MPFVTGPKVAKALSTSVSVGAPAGGSVCSGEQRFQGGFCRVPSGLILARIVQRLLQRRQTVGRTFSSTVASGAGGAATPEAGVGGTRSLRRFQTRSERGNLRLESTCRCPAAPLASRRWRAEGLQLNLALAVAPSRIPH